MQKLHNRVVLPTLHFTCWFHDNHRKARLGSSIEYITDDPISSKQTQWEIDWAIFKAGNESGGGPGLLARDCRRLGADDTTRSPVCCEGQ